MENFEILQPIEIEKNLRKDTGKSLRELIELNAGFVLEYGPRLMNNGEDIPTSEFCQRFWNFRTSNGTEPATTVTKLTLSCFALWYGERTIFHKTTRSGEIQTYNTKNV